MHLIQILLPLEDNAHKRFPRAYYSDVAKELTEKFGGATIYSRAPAQGLWQDESATVSDTIIIVEVMVESPAPRWWRAFRERLEEKFRQEQIIVRSMSAELLQCPEVERLRSIAKETYRPLPETVAAFSCLIAPGLTTGDQRMPPGRRIAPLAEPRFLPVHFVSSQIDGIPVEARSVLARPLWEARQLARLSSLFFHVNPANSGNTCQFSRL
jgi:hypothetical protein